MILLQRNISVIFNNTKTCLRNESLIQDERYTYYYTRHFFIVMRYALQDLNLRNFF